MVIIRLSRRGSKNRPTYGVMVADRRKPRDGAFIEQVGVYNPRSASSAMTLKLDRIQYWLSHGAQASDTVRGLIKKFIKTQRVMAEFL